MSRRFEFAHAVLAQRKKEALYRQTMTLRTPQGRHVIVDGSSFLNFCSNDYLGLAFDAQLIKVAQQAAETYGTGSGSAHLICGHLEPHEALEAEICQWLNREKSLTFSTGYMANLAVLSSLADKETDIFMDKLTHASLIDGAQLSAGRLRRYPHCDISVLEKWLSASRARRKLVVTDGVFSMDGNIAPLKAISEVCLHYDAILIVDDAHGFGVIGSQGGGVLSALELSQQSVPLVIGTFGKALGGSGAFVAGDACLIDYIKNTARPYIYTTASSPINSAVSQAAIKRVKGSEALRGNLWARVSEFKLGCEKLDLELASSESAICPWVVGEARKALEYSEAMKQMGVWVSAIRPPTIPQNRARLRFTLTAAHTSDDVEQLLSILEKITGE